MPYLTRHLLSLTLFAFLPCVLVVPSYFDYTEFDEGNFASRMRLDAGSVYKSWGTPCASSNETSLGFSNGNIVLSITDQRDSECNYTHARIRYKSSTLSQGFYGVTVSIPRPFPPGWRLSLPRVRCHSSPHYRLETYVYSQEPNSIRFMSNTQDDQYETIFQMGPDSSFEWYSDDADSSNSTVTFEMSVAWNQSCAVIFLNTTVIWKGCLGRSCEGGLRDAGHVDSICNYYSGTLHLPPDRYGNGNFTTDVCKFEILHYPYNRYDSHLQKDVTLDEYYTDPIEIHISRVRYIEDAMWHPDDTNRTFETELNETPPIDDDGGSGHGNNGEEEVGNDDFLSLYLGAGVGGGLVFLLFVVVFILTIVFLLVLRSQTKGKNDGDAAPVQRKGGGLSLSAQEQQLSEEGVALASFEINDSLYKIDLDDISLEKEIGAGGADAVIYLAKWKKQQVAVKVFRYRSFSGQSHYDVFEKEISLALSLSHPSLIRFYGSCISPPRIALVMEFCSRGTLQKYCEERLPGMRKRFELLLQVADGIEYLHDRNVMHRDIKSGNVLIDEGDNAKIIDFGLSRVVTDDGSKKTVRIGTPGYMAPELFLGLDYDASVDVFALGVLMYEVITNDFDPYQGNSGVRVATNPDFRPDFENCSDSVIPLGVKRLATSCWAHEPEERPTIQETSERLSECIKSLEQETEDKS